jgi:hypothetical protein
VELHGSEIMLQRHGGENCFSFTLPLWQEQR